MAITAMGLGTKSLEGNYNLDPQDQFWSWLRGMAKDHTKGTIFSGFAVEPTDPAGMSVQVGGHALTPDSAVYYGDGTDGNFFSRHNVLLSSDGVPTKVELSGANTSGFTIYYIVSYVMPASSVAASSQTAGTPELVKTMAVTGASYGAPTASEIEAAKMSGAEPGYIIWGQVSISEKTTTVTSSNITQANDMSGGNMRATRGLLYDDSLSKTEYLEAPIFNGWWAKMYKFTNIGLVICSLDGRENPIQTATSSNSLPIGWRPQTPARCTAFIGGEVATFIINVDGTAFFWRPGTAQMYNAELNGFVAWKV